MRPPTGKRRAIAAGLAAVFLCGCAALTPVTRLKGGEYKDGARRFTATVPDGWMRFNGRREFIMTRDGTVLEHILVKRTRLNTELEHTKKRFVQDMLPQDVAEVAADNVRADPDTQGVKILANEPAEIDGRPAYRLGYEYAATGGLKVKNIQYGFLDGDYVYRILYRAAKQHYFQARRGAFERFIGSFRVIQ